MFGGLRILTCGALAFVLALGLCGVSAGADASLIGWYQFEGNANDSSGYGNHGTAYGSPTWIAGPPSRGGVLQFDGANDYVGIGKILLANVSQFTMAGWVKAGNASGSRIGLFGQNDVIEAGFMGGNAEIWTSAAATTTTPWPFQTLTWHHLAYVANSTSTRIYLDGVLAVTGAGAANYGTSTYNFNIGGGGIWDASGNWFSGQMDDVRVYNRALTATEIRELAARYEATDPVPADGASVGALVYEDNVYMMLNYTPGPTATTHTAYFSDVEQDVIDRDAAHCLGSVPPWPEADPEAFVVGFDDPAIPAYARAPLVLGTTYYWCVDASAGATVWPGEVWSFTVMPEEAWDPSPLDGAVDVITDPNLVLTWRLGDVVTSGCIVSYDVYYGTDPVAVGASSTPYTNVSTTSCEIGPLLGSTGYAWRIDTVLRKTSPPFTVTKVKGDVWQFVAIIDIPVTDESLLAWYRFDANVFDWSGHRNHGAIGGNPQYVPGHIGDAMDFDGAGDCVAIPQVLRDDFTIAFWVNTTQTGGTGQWWAGVGLVDAEVNGGGSDFGTALIGSNFGFGMGATADTTITSTSAVNDGQWHHLAAVRASATGLMEVYVDGVSESTGTGDTAARTFAPRITIGMIQTVGGYFDGQMDDVRLYNRVLSGRELRVMAGLLAAANPNPADNATDVSRTPTLSWSPGAYVASANGNKVYYSEDLSAVANRTAPSATVTNPTFTVPGTLDLGATFYWAVDTVNGVDVWPGELWSFTTIDWLSVDDMESYVPWTQSGNHIFEKWRDGFGDCTPGNGNNTGSTLTENADPVLGGIQSMKYEFDNDGTVYSPCTMGQESGHLRYSRIEAQVAGLPSGIGTNWTIEGVKSLALSFHGTAGNAMTEPLWVQIKGATGYGTKVFYGAFEGESLDDFNEASWHEWNIDLAEFGVALNNVVGIVIGIGNEDGSGAHGSGTLYFDDIRLYVPRCMPQHAKPDGDFDNSCQVDYPDVAVLFENWLLRDVPETAWSGVWQSADIGDVNEPGSFSSPGGGVYSMTAGGADIWGQADAFRYAYQQVSGDCQLTVRVTDIGGPSTNDWRKAGVMIRETLDANSPHAFMMITPAGGNGKAFQWRAAKGGGSSSWDGGTAVAPPTCVRIVRTGDTFRGFYYYDGEWFQQGSAVNIPMSQNVYIGMALTSHDYANECTATFDRACSDEFIPMDLLDDGVINFKDYAVLMSQWLDKVLWP